MHNNLNFHPGASRLTTGSLAGDLARIIGNAKDDTTNPIVMNIASSYAAVLLDPEFSVYRRAINVGSGDNT